MKFFRFPILFTLTASSLLACTLALLFTPQRPLDNLLIFFLLTLTAILTLENVVLLFIKPDGGKRDRAVKKLEPIGLLFGSCFHAIFQFDTIVFQDWNEVVHEGERHSPLALDRLPVFLIVCFLGLIGYALLRYSNPTRLPPLVTVLSLSAVDLGTIFFALLLLQCAPIVNHPLLWIFPTNILLIVIRLTTDTVLRLATVPDSLNRYPLLAFFFRHQKLLPLWSFLVAFPLLGLLIVVLMLLGQKPDSVIRLWTETADWTFSRMTPPPSIPMDGHYLCTVAARGHRRVVKPLRIGTRHGHSVIVNRQLCVANAFEDLLHERWPRFHRAVRRFYDRYGYPISRHIRTKSSADLVYLIMKPLEWCFLAVLYLFDVKPENRIAVQYPHAPLLSETLSEEVTASRGDRS